MCCAQPQPSEPPEAALSRGAYPIPLAAVPENARWTDYKERRLSIGNCKRVIALKLCNGVPIRRLLLCNQRLARIIKVHEWRLAWYRVRLASGEIPLSQISSCYLRSKSLTAPAYSGTTVNKDIRKFVGI
jgi:hypothetical protein